jgi:hypothetical protein
MVMRAQARGGPRGGPQREIAGAEDGKLDPRPDEALQHDDLVMMLVTRDTWERARALGRAYGHPPAELFAFALKALQEKAEAAGLVPSGAGDELAGRPARR